MFLDKLYYNVCQDNRYECRDTLSNVGVVVRMRRSINLVNMYAKPVNVY